jgi:hypothetical protein
MKNFVVGAVLGTLFTYWYLTQFTQTRAMLEGYWTRASSTPTARRSH